MFKKTTQRLLCFTAMTLLLAKFALAEEPVTTRQVPLAGPVLRDIVSEHSIEGVTQHHRTPYQMYFFKDGKLLYTAPNNIKQQTYWGTWSVKGDTLTTQWPTYKAKSTPNTMHFYLTEVKDFYTALDLHGNCGQREGVYCPEFKVVSGMTPALKTASRLAVGL